MSYKVVQKIRNNYYLYEVSAEWDPETKRSKQKRTYIGKCDETGQLVGKKESTIIVKDMGEYYLLHKICIRCGLWDAMCKVYGTERSQFLFAHFVSRVTRSCPPTQTSYAVRASILPEFFRFTGDIDHASVQNYMKTLIPVYEKRNELFRELAKDESAVIYELDQLVEPINFYKLYGMNPMFNFNEFPRKSVFIGQGQDTKLPFYFNWSNYSTVDISTLRKITDEMEDMGVKDITFYLGIKDFTGYEIETFTSINYHLVFELSKGGELYSEFRKAAETVGIPDTVLYDGVLYKFKAINHVFGHYPYTLYVITNMHARNEGLTTFYRSLKMFEDTVSKLKWSKTLEDRIEYNYGLKDLRKYFVLERGEDDSVVVKLDQDEVLAKDADIGIQIIASDSCYDLEDILEIMHRGRRLEQDITIFRTDLQGGAALFPSNESALASSMGDFFSSIVKTALINDVVNSGLSESMNYLDVISEASQIKSIWVEGEYMVNPLTQKQLEMFRMLGIEPPKKYMYQERLNGSL